MPSGDDIAKSEVVVDVSQCRTGTADNVFDFRGSFKWTQGR